MYGTIQNTKRDVVNRSADTRVLQMLRISTASAVLRQYQTTTTTTYTGLSRSDAESLCVASESSELGQDSRPYLGAARIRLGSGGVSVWNTIENCWGTRVTSQISRINDTNLYSVAVTTQVMTVANTGGELDLL